MAHAGRLLVYGGRRPLLCEQGWNRLITILGLRWGLTVLFVVCAGLYTRQMFGERKWQPTLGWLLHVLMAIAMVAMAWPVGMRIPSLLYVLVFTAAALYFVYLGLFGPHVNHAFYHAVMMGAMVVMALLMQSAAMPGMTVTPTSAMAGHNMPMVHATATNTGSSGSPVWGSTLCGLAAAGFVGVALWSFVVLIRTPHRPCADTLMSLGMGVAFAGMAI
jgi:hypothetical protein